MTALLRVEVRRLLARRLARVLVLLAIGGIAIAGVTVFLKSSADGRPSVAASVVTNGDQKLVECGGIMSGPLPEGMSAEDFCASTGFVAVDPRFHLTELHDVWLGVGGQLIVIAWLVGASFLGAEWHAGTVTTFLTWEPRRARVFVAKLLACVAVVFVATVALELLLGAALLPAALFRGTTAGAGGAWWAEQARLLLRVGAACAFGSALGYGIAAIGRNTAASLGAGFVYLVVVENLVRGLKPQWQPWLLGDNVVSFLAGARDAVIAGRSPLEAAAVMAVYGAVPVLAGLWLFRRRDVT